MQSLALGEWIGLISFSITTILTLLGLAWNAATLSAKVTELIEWRKKHEPTSIEIVEVKTLLAGMTVQLSEMKVDIQRLYDRGQRSNRTGQ